MGNTPTPVYDELLELVTDAATPEKILTFTPSSATQARVDDLLERNRRSCLTPAEARELDEYERLEHLVRLLKTRALQKRSA